MRMFRTDFLDLFRTSSLYRWTAAASGVLLLLTIALPVWRILPLSSVKPFIPLHYNVYMGVDAFGPWYDVFVLPALGFVLLAVNLVFQVVFFRRERILSVFFAVATVASEAVLLAAMLMIVLLNV
ncbi:hypothetical protein EBS80_01930 [bacterium]|nr:hypothetical protein [bacterium]